MTHDQTEHECSLGARKRARRARRSTHTAVTAPPPQPVPGRSPPPDSRRDSAHTRGVQKAPASAWSVRVEVPTVLLGEEHVTAVQMVKFTVTSKRRSVLT